MVASRRAQRALKLHAVKGHSPHTPAKNNNLSSAPADTQSVASRLVLRARAGPTSRVPAPRDRGRDRRRDSRFGSSSVRSQVALPSGVKSLRTGSKSMVPCVWSNAAHRCQITSDRDPPARDSGFALARAVPASSRRLFWACCRHRTNEYSEAPTSMVLRPYCPCARHLF
jgi:hypothetical protein